MRRSGFLSVLPALVLAVPAAAQTGAPAGSTAAPAAAQAQPGPALLDVFKQGKDLWSNQGDRDGAEAKFDQLLAALEPRASSLPGEWPGILCETYNWLAVLEDRNPAKKADAVKRLEALVAFNPDFELDKNLTSAKLLTLYDSLRSATLAKVNFTFLPEGGVLRVDGKTSAPAPSRYLGLGAHQVVYAKPGYGPQTVDLELAAKESRNVDFKLDRNASTITLYTYPSGADLSLDGKPLGKTSGQAPADAASLADKAGLKPEDLSGPFVLPDLKTGKHLLELRAPCFRPKRVELDESFTTPYADHILEPIKLAPSRGTLTVTSLWPGGELFLSGQSHGPLPVKDLSVCAGAYDLVVKYPAGGFSQSIEIPEDKSVSLAAKPKPRLAFLGLDSPEDFPGKSRLLAQMQSLGNRLKEVAFLKARDGETVEAALARIKTGKEAELTLSLVVPKDPQGFPVEVVVSTLQGESERYPLKPLDEDPLAGLASRLNTQPRIWEPSAGLLLADLPGEPGPVVIRAGEASKASIQLLRPITQAGGKPVATALDFQRVLSEWKEDSLPVVQAGVNMNLPVRKEPLELPLHASRLCYPFALAELRLRALAAKGEEAAFLKLNQAIALMHFRRFDRALELLREARLPEPARPGPGLGQGTVDYYSGICLSKLGSVYIPEAIQAFLQAQKSPDSTLFGPDGPLVAPLARQAAEDLKN